MIIGLFVLLPILMALWVSITAWNGQGSPFTSSVEVVGLENYTGCSPRMGWPARTS